MLLPINNPRNIKTRISAGCRRSDIAPFAVTPRDEQREDTRCAADCGDDADRNVARQEPTDGFGGDQKRRAGEGRTRQDARQARSSQTADDMRHDEACETDRPGQGDGYGRH